MAVEMDSNVYTNNYFVILLFGTPGFLFPLKWNKNYPKHISTAYNNIVSVTLGCSEYMFLIYMQEMECQFSNSTKTMPSTIHALSFQTK